MEEKIIDLTKEIKKKLNKNFILDLSKVKDVKDNIFLDNIKLFIKSNNIRNLFCLNDYDINIKEYAYNFLSEEKINEVFKNENINFYKFLLRSNKITLVNKTIANDKIIDLHVAHDKNLNKIYLNQINLKDLEEMKDKNFLVYDFFLFNDSKELKDKINFVAFQTKAKLGIISSYEIEKFDLTEEYINSYVEIFKRSDKNLLYGFHFLLHKDIITYVESIELSQLFQTQNVLSHTDFYHFYKNIYSKSYEYDTPLLSELFEIEKIEKKFILDANNNFENRVIKEFYIQANCSPFISWKKYVRSENINEELYKDKYLDALKSYIEYEMNGEDEYCKNILKNTKHDKICFVEKFMKASVGLYEILYEKTKNMSEINIGYVCSNYLWLVYPKIEKQLLECECR